MINKRVIFIVIIVILAISMSLPFMSNFSVNQKAPTPAANTASSQQNQADDTPQGVEGVVREMTEGQFSEGTHILEAGGITIAALTNGTGINLDKYIGKDVRIFGDPKELGTDEGILITVSKIEEVKK